MSKLIGVIGSGDPSDREDIVARNIGSLIAAKGAVLVCGGLSGIMESASRGAFEAGGLTLGILPGEDRSQANPYIQIVIPSGMGVGRNVLVVRSSDALIAMKGGTGTLSEIALALNTGKPVVDMGSWNLEGMLPAASPEEAVRIAFSLLGER
ncbi:MAG: TIGR00725 family protein [bacterium]|nr:MAG: TIGR00725 family protein [bacterium]